MDESEFCGSHCDQCNVSRPERPFCECTWPNANLGELAPDASFDCSIRQDTVMGMQAVGTLIWTAAFMASVLASINARRSSIDNSKWERMVMLWLVAASALNASWHARVASSSYPGEFSLALDLKTTIIYFVGNCMVYGFIFSLPFVRSGTSVIPFALQEAFPKMRRHVMVVAIIVFIFSQGVQALLFVLYAFPEFNVCITTVYYALSAVWGGLVSLLFIVVSNQMISRLRGMVDAPNLPAYHRTKLVLTLRSTVKVRQVVSVSSILTVPPLLAFAASPVIQRYSYAFVPIVSYTYGIIILRHSIKSVLISKFVALQSTSELRSQHDRKSRPCDDEDRRASQQQQQEGSAGADAAKVVETLSSKAPSPPRSKLELLGKRTDIKKIVRRRQMTRVTEEPSHGVGDGDTQLVTVAEDPARRQSL